MLLIMKFCFFFLVFQLGHDIFTSVFWLTVFFIRIGHPECLASFPARARALMRNLFKTAKKSKFHYTVFEKIKFKKVVFGALTLREGTRYASYYGMLNLNLMMLKNDQNPT